VLDSLNEKEELDQINPSRNRFVFLCLIETCSARPAIDDDGVYVMKDAAAEVDSASHLPSTLKLDRHGRRWHGIAQLANSNRRR
jgi:hypothetical protein